MRAVNHGWISLLLMPLMLAGCATQEIKVACDGKLQPINSPADPKVAQLAHSQGASDARTEVAR